MTKRTSSKDQRTAWDILQDEARPDSSREEIARFYNLFRRDLSRGRGNT